MNKFKVAVTMFLCMAIFCGCGNSLVPVEYQFKVFKYNDGIDYSENMPDYYPKYLNNYDHSWYGNWRHELKTTKLAENYYAAEQRNVNDVYFTTLTIDDYIELDSLGLLNQALVDSLPKDSNTYYEFYSTKIDKFAVDCWNHYGQGLDTAKINLVIRNGELDKYFNRLK